MPVFFKEKGCIRKLPVLIRAVKYSISYRKLQGLPYILYIRFLYDGIVQKGEPLRLQRRPPSLKRREELLPWPLTRKPEGKFGKSILLFLADGERDGCTKRPFFRIEESLFHQKETPLIESSRSPCDPSP
jgi:hypothetical protein